MFFSLTVLELVEAKHRFSPFCCGGITNEIVLVQLVQFSLELSSIYIRLWMFATRRWNLAASDRYFPTQNSRLVLRIDWHLSMPRLESDCAKNFGGHLRSEFASNGKAQVAQVCQADLARSA